MSRRILCLVSALISVGVLLGCSEPKQAARTPEVVATLPPGQPESITQAKDGSFYITSLLDGVLLKVTADGNIQKIPFPDVASVVGVAPYEDGVAVGVLKKCYIATGRVEGEIKCVLNDKEAASGPMAVTDAEAGLFIVDKDGNVTKRMWGRPDAFFNGLTAIGNGKFLAADTHLGVLWEIDPANSTIEVWFQDGLKQPDGKPFGFNGVEYVNGWVYVNYGYQKELYRIQMGADGKANGGLVFISKGVAGDDFAVGKDGTVYAEDIDVDYTEEKEGGFTLKSVSPKGEITPFIENNSRLACATVSDDGKWLYWPTRFAVRGTFGTMPNKLMRVPIP